MDRHNCAGGRIGPMRHANRYIYCSQAGWRDRMVMAIGARSHVDSCDYSWTGSDLGGKIPVRWRIEGTKRWTNSTLVRR